MQEFKERIAKGTPKVKPPVYFHISSNTVTPLAKANFPLEKNKQFLESHRHVFLLTMN